MKKILITSLVLLFLTACAGSDGPANNTTVITSPGTTGVGAVPLPVVIKLKATNKGLVSFIDFQVHLPAGTTSSLLDYNGSATLKGIIQGRPPCMSVRKAFNCNATLVAGNINANCPIGGHNVALQIVMTRGDQVRETYNILSIIVEAPFSCFTASQ